MTGNYYLRVDVSDAMGVLDKAKRNLTEQKLNTLMTRVISDTTRGLKTEIARAVRNEYNVRIGEVVGTISGPKVGGGSGVIEMYYDLSNTRIRLSMKKGRSKYGAYRVFTGRGKLRKATGVKAGIVKGGEENLPTNGDRPHYIFAGERLVVKKKHTYYTKMENGHAHKRNSFSCAVGIGIPQMPMNRSAAEVENLIARRMLASAEKHYGSLL